MDSAKILGNRIQKIRTAKKITQEELARRTDKSPHFISDVERGKKKPSVFTLIELIQGLETTPNEILSDFVTLEDELLSDDRGRKKISVKNHDGLQGFFRQVMQ